MILTQTPLSPEDTVYWIYSTIPQVLAALVGLIVTGVLFYYPSLDKRVEVNSEVKDIVDTIKNRLHWYVGFLLTSSAVAIVLDILIMRYATFSASVMTSEAKLICCIPLSICFWVSLLINLIPLFALIKVMMRIMSPKFEDYTIEQERIRIDKQQQKVIKEEEKESQKGIKEQSLTNISEKSKETSVKTGRIVKITDMQFLEHYIKFEKLARQWAVLQGIDEDSPMRSIINNLKQRDIITQLSYVHLMEASRIRNFIAHGKPISNFSGIIMSDLINVTGKIKKILSNNQDRDIKGRNHPIA